MTRNEWSKRKGRSSSFVRKSLRFAIYARDNFDCVYCRGIFPPDYSGHGLTLDHVKPRYHGGASTADNLVTACTRCNSSKQAHMESQGLFRIKGRRESDRVRRQLRKPINRELGLWLARMAGRNRGASIIAPIIYAPDGIAALQERDQLCLTTP